VTYLLGRRLGPAAEEAFVRALAQGELRAEPMAEDDWSRAADLMVAYADLPLGFVDASIVAMAERLGVTTLLTTDRRHFGVVRPRHVERLTLVP
jgi:predicted nucleic acid-binding protein